MTLFDKKMVWTSPYIDTSKPRLGNLSITQTGTPFIDYLNRSVTDSTRTSRPTRIQIIESARAHKCYAEDDLLNALEQDGLIDDEFAIMPIREVEELLNESAKWTANRGEDGTWHASAHRVADDGTDLMGVVSKQATYDDAVHRLARQVFEWLARR